MDLAIEYAMKGFYRDGLTKDKKRAVRKKAKTIVIDKGEVYITRKSGNVRKLSQIILLKICS